VTKSFIGIRRNRSEERIKQLDAAEQARTFEADDVVHLIVTDLLWLDDQWLLDVPLLERRRVLESVIPASELVRCGPYVRPPYQTWIGSWRAQGFRGLTFKEANSRYRPGETSNAWTTADLPRR
jgi:ATP-dependent DNA ligase